jgi:hypothetical protein
VVDISGRQKAHAASLAVCHVMSGHRVWVAHIPEPHHLHASAPCQERDPPTALAAAEWRADVQKKVLRP